MAYRPAGKYIRLLDRLTECIEDSTHPGLSAAEMSNRIAGERRMAKRYGGAFPYLERYLPFLTKYAFGKSVHSLAELEIELTSRGY